MLEKQGRLPEARAEYEETLRLEPSRIAAKERLTAMGAAPPLRAE